MLISLFNNYNIYCTKVCDNSLKYNNLDPMRINDCNFICICSVLLIHIFLCYSLVFAYTILIALYKYKSLKEFIGDIFLHNFKILFLMTYFYGAYCQVNKVMIKMNNEL